MNTVNSYKPPPKKREQQTVPETINFMQSLMQNRISTTAIELLVEEQAGFRPYTLYKHRYTDIHQSHPYRDASLAPAGPLSQLHRL